MENHDLFSRLAVAQHGGRTAGVFAVCSSNPYVLQAAIRRARKAGEPLLVEATANQVNQFGGYMGQTPAEFQRQLVDLAARCGLPQGQLILGGDHLGPLVWQNEPAETALEKGRTLVAACVRAGYTKIHLDASMSLGGDPPAGPPLEISAARTARLAQAAEAAWAELPVGASRPSYVIGSEVPPAGGARGEEQPPQLTTPESAGDTLETTRRAFTELGLQAAWEAVVALVVQPGVEFGDEVVYPYRREAAAGLKLVLDGFSGLVYEAHSTDFQSPEALRWLVEDHFAILKVGPGLTFAFREALFSLERIESELYTGQRAVDRSNLGKVVEAEMLAYPQDWQRYYQGSAEEQRLKRRFSLSDRIRYYWARPPVQVAVQRLLTNLEAAPIPQALVSQFFPLQAQPVRKGELPAAPQALIDAHIGGVLEAYSRACAG